PELINVADKHQAVKHRDTENGDKSYGRWYRQVQARNPEGKDPPDGRKGNVQENEHGITPASEGGEQHEENKAQRNRYHNHEPAHGPLLVLKLPAVFGKIAGRQVHLLLHFLLDFIDDAAHIAAAHV